MLGLDYSAGRPGGAAIKRDGYGFVVRYLVNGLGGRADLTADEVRDLRANGVEIAVVWERKIIGQPDRSTGGWDVGVADAQAADAQVNAVGLAGWPIYFAVDFDIPDYAPSNADPRAKLGPVGNYLAGALSVVGMSRMGVYGGFWAVSRALDAGLTKYAWQTKAWSGTNEDKRIHLLQRIGSVKVGNVDCDVNEQRQDDYGQHQGDDMTPDDILDAPINRAGGETGVTSLRQIVAWFDADLNGQKAEVTAKIADLANGMAAALKPIADTLQSLSAAVAKLQAAQQPAVTPTGPFKLHLEGDVDATPTAPTES